MAIPLPLAEEIILIMVAERPFAPMTGAIPLKTALERYGAGSDLERVLVVMTWLWTQGSDYVTAPEINAALESAGEPAVRFASAYLTRASARGECSRVGPGMYELAWGGRQRLAAMRECASAPAAEVLAARAQALAGQTTPIQTEHAKSASTSGGSARNRARHATQARARSRRAA